MKCSSDAVPIGKLWVKKNRIDLNPPYQREAGIWSEDKQQLFMDSILNGFDVPKLYFHDRTGEKGPYSDSVVDGKQRLSSIWAFMEDGFPLASDFEFSGDKSFFEGSLPSPNQKYSEFSEEQKEYFRGQTIDVVTILDADEDDIEELFSRLNNGEPLNAAEKRNAMGGNMIKLVRELAKSPELKQSLSFKDKRMSFHEVSAKLVKMEISEKDGHGIFCDLKKKFLDQMVEKNKGTTEAELEGLKSRVLKNLKVMNKVFSKNDPLLNKQSYPQLYYGWIKEMSARYSGDGISQRLRSFLEDFHARRIENLQKPEDERDPYLIEYGRLTQQGTNDLQSMVERSTLLTRYFLQDNPDVSIKDPKRQFSSEERYVIWIRSGKQCQNQGCSKALPDLADMHADHVKAWVKGGTTTLENAQALCADCNGKKSSS
ncbi:MAG: DUF262 domain-containing protein [Hyphomonas sp.]|uniref:HNH endonuclease family protein n=1 Tax=Hyphomonas sp. TaxID=87 RepID=UPI003526E9CA